MRRDVKAGKAPNGRQRNTLHEAIQTLVLQLLTSDPIEAQELRREVEITLRAAGRLDELKRSTFNKAMLDLEKRRSETGVQGEYDVRHTPRGRSRTIRLYWV